MRIVKIKLERMRLTNNSWIGFECRNCENKQTQTCLDCYGYSKFEIFKNKFKCRNIWKMVNINLN